MSKCSRHFSRSVWAPPRRTAANSSNNTHLAKQMLQGIKHEFVDWTARFQNMGLAGSLQASIRGTCI